MWQSFPGTPQVVAEYQQRPCPHRTGYAGPQCGPKRCKSVATVVDLANNSDGREGTQQTVERGRVCLRRDSEGLDVTRPAGKAVGDPEFGCRMNKSRGPGTIEQGHHRAGCLVQRMIW